MIWHMLPVRTRVEESIRVVFRMGGCNFHNFKDAQGFLIRPGRAMVNSTNTRRYTVMEWSMSQLFK